MSDKPFAFAMSARRARRTRPLPSQTRAAFELGGRTERPFPVTLLRRHGETMSWAGTDGERDEGADIAEVMLQGREDNQSAAV